MLDILKDAFKTAFNKPLTYAALIAIPLIVACFALLYFATFMDPYERMRELPIAVINQDAGATLNGEERNLGDELVESITNNDDANGPSRTKAYLIGAWKTPITILPL
mgnify:CR=1